MQTIGSGPCARPTRKRTGQSGPFPGWPVFVSGPCSRPSIVNHTPQSQTCLNLPCASSGSSALVRVPTPRLPTARRTCPRSCSTAPSFRRSLSACGCNSRSGPASINAIQDLRPILNIVESCVPAFGCPSPTRQDGIAGGNFVESLFRGKGYNRSQTRGRLTNG